MFDRTFVTAGPERIDIRHTTHEHRAPTDDSVKLLAEMREKTVASILAEFECSNVVNAKWFVFSDPMNFRSGVACKFSINGKNLDFKFALSDRDFDIAHSPAEIAQEIQKKVVDELSRFILPELFMVIEDKSKKRS